MFAVSLVGVIPLTFPNAAATEHLVLRVGGQDEMKTRNPLSPLASEPWTEDVLDRVYGSVVLRDPVFDQTTAYAAKGVDFDDDGIFEASEYDVWAERAGVATPLEVAAYFDFNGMRWHDGTSVTVWDLLFSYHLNAMNPRTSMDLRAAGASGSGVSYDAGGRRLNIVPVDRNPATPELEKNWEGEGTMAGDPNLRVAVKFTLTEPYVRFYDRTLGLRMFPMHVWSRTGGGRHGDFGCAIWIPLREASAKGLAECATQDSSKWGRGIALTEIVPGTSPYRFADAEAWRPTDADVVGSGPFRFRRWIPGLETVIERYEGHGALGAYDPRLAAQPLTPRINAIQFRVFRTAQLGVFALASNEIDFFRGNIGPEFVPDLLKHPAIAVEANPELGYYYLATNLRRLPWGYEGGDPAKDVGLPLRKALPHVVDKKSIVQNGLRNFGVVAHGFVSTANAFWYNDNIPKPAFDPEAARAILDSAEAQAAGIGPDPPGPCYRDSPEGCRTLPGIGQSPFDILTPQADYDPVRAAAGAMIADAMRQVGLNAASKPTAFGEIVHRINVRDYDLYILGWRIGDPDPSYLFAFFHSSTIVAGANYHGYSNKEFDRVVDAAQRELDRNVRRQLIFRAQEILAETRPAEPLYFGTNIEAYRRDCFIGWTVLGGTLWNDWSLLRLRCPQGRSLQVGIDVETVVAGNASVPVVVAVRDSAGTMVPEATLALSVESPTGDEPGLLLAGGDRGTNLTLITDGGGRARATYRAPLVDETTRPVVVRAAASHPDYAEPGADETILTIVGRELSFLRVRIELPAGDIVTTGGLLPVRLLVRNDLGVVPDAAVEARGYPEGHVAPTSGLAQDFVTFFASFPTPGVYAIGVNATMADHRPAWGVAYVWVVSPPEPRPPPPPEEQPGLDWIAPLRTITIIAAIAAAGLLAFWVVLRREGRRGSRKQ